MKKFLVATVFLFAGLGIAHADFLRQVDGAWFPPKDRKSMTEAIYITSVTCQNNAIDQAPIKISTSASLVYAVAISSPGQAGSTFQLFDAQISTTGQRPITAPIIGSTIMEYTLNVYASSGITYSNFGPASAPCATVIYTFR